MKDPPSDAFRAASPADRIKIELQPNRRVQLQNQVKFASCAWPSNLVRVAVRTGRRSQIVVQLAQVQIKRCKIVPVIVQ
jgi:hypothetical protein